MTKAALRSVKEIEKTGFEYFMNFSNFDEKTSGYGLTPYHTNNLEVASIAATGFHLSSYVIGVENFYISFSDAKYKIIKILETLYLSVDHYKGFFAHFVDTKTGKRHKKSEYSTIDTALALNGVMTVSSYFGDDRITELSNLIINRVDWAFLIYDMAGKKMLHMAYNPDKDGDYANGKPGFIHHWSMFAEQLMMYVLIASSHVDNETAKALYDNFDRVKGSYKGHEYFHSPGNSLFIYQFPQAWLNLKNIKDDAGICWYDNAVSATLGHRAFCIKHQNQYKTFSKRSFGLSASDSPKGYRVFHAIPSVNDKYETDGTISPHAMIGSLPLTPKESLAGIKYMRRIPGLWQKYGFMDAYNQEDGLWISSRYISIDKGLETLMANAFLTNTIRNAYMSHPLIIKGMEVLKWQKIG